MRESDESRKKYRNSTWIKPKYRNNGQSATKLPILYIGKRPNDHPVKE